QVRVDTGGVAWLHRAHGFDTARRVQVGLDLQQFVGAGLALGRYPGRGEVVLHHGDPAVVGLFDVVALVFGDVREGDLLEFVLFRVDREARERVIEAGRVRRVVAVALELQVQRRRQRRIDRKSTRLNSSHVKISYAVFC